MGKPRRRAAASARAAARGIYVFRLFVAGYESNSAQARDNLTRLCEAYLPGRHRIEIVDVLKNASAALTHHVLVTPTLLVVAPHVKVTLLGNLSDTRDVLAALQLVGDTR